MVEEYSNFLLTVNRQCRQDNFHSECTAWLSVDLMEEEKHNDDDDDRMNACAADLVSRAVVTVVVFVLVWFFDDARVGVGLPYKQAAVRS
jgi:hypothetical protein